MGKKSMEQEQRVQDRKRRKNIKIGAVILSVAIVIAGLFMITNLIEKRNSPSTISAVPNEEGDLVVPLNSLGKNMSYIEYGGKEEIAVFVNKDGNVLTGFDTCIDCYMNGEVHYTKQEDFLICSSCGNPLALEDFGKALWGGCQPISIPEDYRTDADNNIIIPSAILSFADEMFNEWDTGNYNITMEQYDPQ